MDTNSQQPTTQPVTSVSNDQSVTLIYDLQSTPEGTKAKISEKTLTELKDHHISCLKPEDPESHTTNLLKAIPGSSTSYAAKDKPVANKIEDKNPHFIEPDLSIQH